MGTKLNSKLLLGNSRSAKKKLKLTPRNSTNSKVKLAPLLRTRKKRRKKNLKQHQHPRNLNLLKSQMLLMKPYLLNLNQRTHLMPCPKELSTLKISNDSTPTTMKPFPSPTSGRSSTRRTILSGLENTNTMKS